MTDFHPAYHQACREANERIAALEADRTAREETFRRVRDERDRAEAEAERVASAAARISEEKEQVEDELAALKARRCETCGFCVYGANDRARLHGVTSPTTGWCEERGGLWWLHDYCSRWTAREDG